MPEESSAAMECPPDEVFVDLLKGRLAGPAAGQVKTHFAMMLVLAASSLGVAACVGAPAEEVESTEAPMTAEGAGAKASAPEVTFLSKEEAKAAELGADSITACTLL